MSLTRRDFLKYMGVSAAMLAAAGCAAKDGGTPTDSKVQSGSNDGKTTDSLSTASTEGVAATEEEGNDQQVVVCIKQDPAPLSPWSGDRDVRVYIQNTCYQPLYRFDGYGGELVPCLAKSYKKVDDYSIEVEILDHIYDSDGNHLTASDVKFSYETALELGNYARISDVKSVDVVSDYVAKINYHNSVETVGVLDNSLTTIFMVCEKPYTESEDNLNTRSCGTARYKITDYVEGATVTVEKRNDYWETDPAQIGKYDKANVGTVRFDVITESSSRAIGLQKREIDFCAFLDANDYQLFEDGGESSDDFNILASNTPYLYTYTFNCDDACPLSNKDLRKAICYAIDCDAVGLKAFGAAALNVRGSGSPSYVGYQEDWNDKDYYDYNPDKAKEHLQAYLDATGTKLDDLKIRIYVGMMGGMNTMAELAQAYLSAIGINAEAQVYDSATLSQIKADTTQWEISAYTGYANKYITENWDLNFDSRDYSGHTMTYARDEVLQEKLLNVMQVSNFTPENINDFNDYITENAYFLPVCGQIQRLVYASYCTECVVDGRGIPMPGASSYDWSLK